MKASPDGPGHRKGNMELDFGHIHFAISNLAIIAGVLLAGLIAVLKNP